MRGLGSGGYMALGLTADCVDCVGFLVRILLPLLRPLAPITARKLRKIRSILWLKGLASPPDNKQSRDSLQLMLRRCDVDVGFKDDAATAAHLPWGLCHG